jgi:arylformamidase
MAQGANLELSAITTTVHVGAHTDAPKHYALGAPGIAERDLALYYGPVQVVDAPGSGRILPSEVPEVSAPRVLFRTGSFPDPDHFNTDFRSLSPELVVALARQGVVLVGLDTPSVDPFDDKVLQAHNAIARADMAILEGVVLGHVDPGLYTLVAFPLKLAGADASPVRAVLIRD